MSSRSLVSRIHGCWLGKSIGGTLGLPAEGRMERLNFSFYDPVPTVAPPNDDLELQLVWLQLVENGGSSLAQADFAGAWLRHIHYMWDEYGRCRWNLRRGVPVENVGTFEKHFHAGMGSPIRSEIWACLFPGDPASAGYYAALDASLDHGVEGIAGEVFFAVMQNHVLAGTDVKTAIALALERIPATTAIADGIHRVIQGHAKGIEVWACRDLLLKSHDNENFTHAPLNVALTVWALLYGEGDFERSLLYGVNCGYDTDCTAAAVGATLGLASGASGIPAHWSKPIGNGVFTGPGIQGIQHPETLEELTERTAAQIGKLEKGSWEQIPWSACNGGIRLEDLPGTISLYANGSGPIPWANGELPPEVKAAGCAEWEWTAPETASRTLVCLARGGAKLFLDGKLVIECPAGLPFVPATHRPPDASRLAFAIEKGTHKMRLELGKTGINQDASLLLAYPNLHICPWSNEELPHPALL